MTATLATLLLLVSAWSNAMTPSAELGGYKPVSDVAQHARMSLDICDIGTLLEARPIDYASIGTLYRDGRHSTEGDGSKRTLAEFARGSRATEHLLSRYERHFGSSWIDGFARSALEGTGSFTGEADHVRQQTIRIATRDQVLVGWAFHELDAAVDKAMKGNFAIDTGAPHNWDEVRAYYYGVKPECSSHATAEERGREFGTKSAVSERILTAMNQGLKALLAHDAGAAARARDEIVRNILITYIQSAIKSATHVDAAIREGKKDAARAWQAAGLAYFRVIEPLVAGANPRSARAVSAVFDLTKAPGEGAGAAVDRAFADAYDALGIRPSEVGQYAAR
jgi:hypothetical protein